MKKKTFSALPLILCLLATGLSAQTLTDVKIDPPQAVVGQSVTASINLTTDTANCGLRFYWGDGATADVRIGDKTVVPVKLTHVYEKAGEYRTMAEGKRVATSLKCNGANIVRIVAVTAPVAPPPLPATTKGPSCPAGWTLSAKSVNKKTGAFTCTAKAGTALPASKPACPGDLSYFENVKKGLMGCIP